MALVYGQTAAVGGILFQAAVLEQPWHRQYLGCQMLDCRSLITKALFQDCQTTFRTVAEGYQHEVEWSQARHRMSGANGHLDLLLDVCHARGLPILPWEWAPHR
jgi:hypothetical protein